MEYMCHSLQLSKRY